MKLRTSFYNKAMIKNDLRRFGFIGIVYGIMTLLVVDFGLIGNSGWPYLGKEVSEFIVVRSMMPNAWDIISLFIVPVILGLALFRYIQEEGAVSSIHAYPVSRKSLFVSHFISFEIIYMSPVVINGLVIMCLLLFKGFSFATIMPVLLGYIFSMLICGTALFGITVFFGMLVGSTLLQAGLTYLMMATPIIAVESVRYLLSWILRGFPLVTYDQAIHFRITPYYATVALANNTETWIMVGSLFIMAVYAIASLLGGYLLYQKRALERHHDLIVFDLAKIIFVILMTFISTIGIAVIVGAIIGDSSEGAYAGILIGSLLSYSLTKMIVEKKVNVLCYYKRALMVMAAFLLVLIAVDIDIVGYENSVPKTKDVAYMYYTEGGHMSYKQIVRDDYPYYNRIGMAVELSEDGTIDMVRDLHKELITNSSDGEYKSISLVYVLKNGRKVQRSYHSQIDKIYLQAIHESIEYKEEHLKAINRELARSKDTSIRIEGSMGGVRYIDDVDHKSFFEAYSKDYRAMTYAEEKSGFSSVVATIQYTRKQKDDRHIAYDWTSEESLAILPSYSNTIQWMKKHDFGEYTLVREGIIGANIDTVTLNDEGYYNYNINRIIGDPEVTQSEEEDMAIRDEAIIDQLLSIDRSLSTYTNHYIITFYYDKQRSYSIKVEAIPETLKQYL